LLDDAVHQSTAAPVNILPSRPVNEKRTERPENMDKITTKTPNPKGRPFLKIVLAADVFQSEAPSSLVHIV
jgi:hypothetical protein